MKNNNMAIMRALYPEIVCDNHGNPLEYNKRKHVWVYVNKADYLIKEVFG